ncbi:angiopoietin-4-like [Anopheles darlingi]|uniref:angiopoietin-4-like n=1 Tax=Anopheles darlingi TaxID=43151 RepID=UPI002100581B|nr:angiopoietin-4-like [Anopheles darlingi]
MGFGLEILLTKLEHIDHKLMELQLQMNRLETKIGSSQYTYGKTSTSNATATTPEPQLPLLASCQDAPANVSGLYLIRVHNDSFPFATYCEMEKFGGGWTVVQHRFDGSVNFYRNWYEYRVGFGDSGSEFWIGLDLIHQLTTARKHELIVEIMDITGHYGYARYSEFQVGSESEEYKLKAVGSYSGTAGDALQSGKGKKFSTKDRDNDGRSDINFAVEREGGWWYSFYGGHSNLNGLYGNASDAKSIWWWHFRKDMRGLSYTRMMIREAKK